MVYMVYRVYMGVWDCVGSDNKNFTHLRINACLYDLYKFVTTVGSTKPKDTCQSRNFQKSNNI